MHIHIFMHVPFEGPGCISNWITDNAHTVSYTHWYAHPVPPDLSNTDLLIVMGGPMGVHDEEIYPWLAVEKALIRQAIHEDKAVLGICLGAQLIATVLGANVYANSQKEIGWFPLLFNSHSPIPHTPEELTVFHWHGDTFDIPLGATGFAASAATPHQAFVYNEKVIGLQFHFEVTKETMTEMLHHGEAELIAAPFVQDRVLIAEQENFIPESNALMYRLLDYLNR